MSKSKLEINPLQSERLREIVNDSGMKQADFANKVLHCSQQHLSRMLNKKSPIMRETAQNIEAYFSDIAKANPEKILLKPGIKMRAHRNYLVRANYIMGDDNWKTPEDYNEAMRDNLANTWALSWEHVLECQRARKDTADKAFELFLCMFESRCIGIEFREQETFSNVEYFKRDSNLRSLYNDLLEDREISSNIYCPVIFNDCEIRCLAEDYINAVEKVADYARLVINDLIATSLEKEEARKSGEAFKESSTDG